MIPRGKLDISFSALFRGIGYCFSEILGIKDSKNTKTEDHQLYTLSVRTGLDLILTSLDFEPGAEILVTNVNIPDMFSILKAHQLVSIPLAVNKHSLEISTEQMAASIRPSTKAILITHLFGAVMNTEAIVRLAKEHGLIVLEDCAQAFNGFYAGHPLSDVVMYSFGLIKTNTSLTGAMLRFNNPSLYHNVALLNDQLPIQSPKLYLKKIFKALAIKVITLKWIFSMLYVFARASNRDFDDVLAGFTKGFPGADVMNKIRYRPCYANLRLMARRIDHFSVDKTQKRKELALSILSNVLDEMKIGRLNLHHTYWVIAIELQNREQLIEDLRAQGCDATAKASSLVKIESAAAFDKDELDLEKLVYLPIDKATRKKLDSIHMFSF
jgi:dTDP-4-amino-4,6-dideoxygalactose transaminase